MEKGYNSDMEYLKEENNNLIQLRTSLITLIIVLTGGLVGLTISADFSLIKLFFIFLGLYFDLLFLRNVINVNDKIIRNVKEMKKWK